MHRYLFVIPDDLLLDNSGGQSPLPIRQLRATFLKRGYLFIVSITIVVLSLVW
jgi:hypothetical protein